VKLTYGSLGNRAAFCPLITSILGCFAAPHALSETLTADTNRPNNSTFVVGENVQIAFHASGLVTKASELSITVRDENGTTAYSGRLDMKGDSHGNATTAFSAPAHTLGYYRVEASLASGTSISGLGTRPAGYVSYAVVPDPLKRVDYGDGGSRFGMQGGFSAAQGDVIPFLGIRYVLFRTAWRESEPKNAGQFADTRRAAIAKGSSFPPKNPVIQAVTYHGAPWPTYSVPLLTSAALPDWALDPSTKGRICKVMGALNPAGIEALPRYARALGAAMATDLSMQTSHYYQVTWEPADWCFAGSPEQLVQFYQLSYEPLHGADPKAIVMGPTLYPEDIEPMRRLWAAGLAKYLDAVSIHPYVKWPPETNNLVSNIRAQMRMARDAKGHPIPFAGTEQGYTSSSIGELSQARCNVRATVILLGEGFKFEFAFYIADFWDHEASDSKSTYGYYWNLNPAIRFGTDKIGPKPVAPAFAAMTYLLDGADSDGAVGNLNGTQMGYRFHRGSTKILVLWDYGSDSSRFKLKVPDSPPQTCDWMANCSTATRIDGAIDLELGQSPTYVIGNDF
jgi:hypothetical protein